MTFPRRQPEPTPSPGWHPRAWRPIAWRDLRLMWADMDDHFTRIERMLTAMADQSALLNSVAEGLRSLGGTVSALVAENATLRARNAELEGEEAAESAATSNVKAEYDSLAALFNSEPSVPDVEPLPEPEPAPVDPEQPSE